MLHSMTDDVPDGEFALVVEALIDWKNERYLKDLSRDVKQGLHDLAEQGFAPGGSPPRGYLLVAWVELGQEAGTIACNFPLQESGISRFQPGEYPKLTCQSKPVSGGRSDTTLFRPTYRRPRQTVDYL